MHPYVEAKHFVRCNIMISAKFENHRRNDVITKITHRQHKANAEPSAWSYF